MPIPAIVAAVAVAKSLAAGGAAAGAAAGAGGGASAITVAGAVAGGTSVGGLSTWLYLSPEKRRKIKRWLTSFYREESPAEIAERTVEDLMSEQGSFSFLDESSHKKQAMLSQTVNSHSAILDTLLETDENNEKEKEGLAAISAESSALKTALSEISSSKALPANLQQNIAKLVGEQKMSLPLLQSVLKDLTAELVKAVDLAERASKNSTELRKSNAKFVARATSLEKSCTRLKGQLQQGNIVENTNLDLSRSIRTLTAQKTEIISTNQSLKTKNNELLETLSTFTAEKKSLTLQIRELLSEKTVQGQALSDLAESNQLLSEQLSELREQNKALTCSISKARYEMPKLASANELLIEENQRLSSIVENQSQEIDRLKQLVATCKQTIAEQTSIISELTELLNSKDSDDSFTSSARLS